MHATVIVTVFVYEPAVWLFVGVTRAPRNTYSVPVPLSVVVVGPVNDANALPPVLELLVWL